MRLSRWGQSPYETDADISLEREALGRLVDVRERGTDAEIVVVHSKIPMGSAEHAKAPSMRMLVTTTSGTDHIDREYFLDSGIAVARLPEARRDAVVDTTIGSLIWGLRRLGSMQAYAANNHWARGRLPEMGPVGLAGARIGVIGLGVIGSRVAEVLSALGAEVFGSDPRGVPVEVADCTVERMMSSCDAVTLHCDLNATTRRMMNREFLETASPDLVLVNTARGDIVDVDAAVDLAVHERIGGLILDVFPTEPWQSMAVDSPRVLLMPHAAGYHRDLAACVRSGLLAAVEAFVSDEPIPHRLDADRDSGCS